MKFYLFNIIYILPNYYYWIDDDSTIIGY